LKNIKSFTDFLQINEMGGWATTKTQGTKITPAVLQEAIGVLENIFNDFNQWAQAHGFHSLTVVGPGGSGVYFKKDLEENPEKAYGDVDIIVMYPLNEPQGRQAEIDTLKKYNGLFLQWLAKTTRPDLDKEETRAISEGTLKLVINLKDGPVQVDIISTFNYSSDWAKARYTPIRGIKGFVVGFLYQAFGNALDVSVTDRGVVAKIKGGELVNPLLRKGVEERIVTRDFNRFLAQLAEFTDEFTRGEKRAVQLDQYLQQHPGIDVTDLSLEQICNGILGFARTLEQNGTFELPKSKYQNSQEFLQEVVNIYKIKIDKHTSSSKYNKAETDLAHQQRAKVMSDAETAFEYVSKKLA
jgi:hypothetical protein